MAQCMVTGRMDEVKKDEGNRVLKREGLNASSAINLMYDRLVEGKSASFLKGTDEGPSPKDWQRAAKFVDSITIKRDLGRFDGMSKAEIKMERLAKRGMA